MADFFAADLGTLIALRPLSEEAEAWVADHLPEDAPRWAGSIAIEPRYFPDIEAGIIEDGLTFQLRDAPTSHTGGRTA